jgi:TfoX/Sxy family transcriptional regulator of competence genes
MMGEFIIYYRGKIVGGIYDDRLLVKPTKSAISYMPTVTYDMIYYFIRLTKKNVCAILYKNISPKGSKI